MSARIYVAAPYEDAAFVRQVHTRLRERKFTPTSSWAETAKGADVLTPEIAQTAITVNDADLRSSDAVFVIARPGAGGEMFCEIAAALMHGIRVFWVGRKVLSAYRDGVVWCGDYVPEALDTLEATMRPVPVEEVAI